MLARAPRTTPAAKAAAQAAVGSHALLASIELLGTPAIFHRNEEIFGENEPAQHIYKVLAGTVRTYKVLNDGRRQIGAFHLAGDIFALEAGERHTFSAEAIGETTVLVIRRSVVTALAERDGEIARQLWTLTARELHRVQAHVLLLIKNAQERVAGFLLEMAERVPAADAIDLPMSRQDIADYLGLTIETVSRTLTQLEAAATIALPSSRRVVLRDRSALNQLSA